MAAHPIPAAAIVPSSPRPWVLPAGGLAVFYGCPATPRLFHYFLPRAIAQGKQVLCLDGANRFDPLLIARLARQRSEEPSAFNRNLRVARAFTCFQLTELLVRVPRLVSSFAASVLIVTGLPELYFDEDVREPEASASFRYALAALEAITRLRLAVAVFSDATSIPTSRRTFFPRLAAQANQVWKFVLQEGDRLTLFCETARPQIGSAP